MKIKNGAWKTLMLVVITLGVYLTSCTKKGQIIGVEIRPTNELELESNDTSSIIAYSILQDSLITTNYTHVLIGSYMDAIFGQTNASYYTQLRLQPNLIDFNFGQNAVIESLILSLSYDGYYGDTTTYQTFKVYEISEPLNSDSGYYYYSNDKVSHYGEELASITFQPKPNTPILQTDPDTITIEPFIEFDLLSQSTQFADKILSTPLEILQDPDSFLEYINGLCVIAEPVNEGGAILYFNLLSAESDLTIKYRNDTSTDAVYKIPLVDSTTRFNNYDHNNYLDASDDFKAQVLAGDASLGQENIYVQALAGVITKVTFPFINTLTTHSNIVINSAELSMSVSEDINGSSPPEKLTLVKINSDGTTSAFIDALAGDTYFGGVYDSINHEYKFQISQYVQQLTTQGATDYGLYIKVYGGAGQITLKGTNPALPASFSDRIKLKVIYTIVE
ncbi:MAG: DUF4270 domain-containing protein [Bacteroidetes bacterium]|nr:DUF4270 domain-containing protein [Bacteroidota bacterium]